MRMQSIPFDTARTLCHAERKPSLLTERGKLMLLVTGVAVMVTLLIAFAMTSPLLLRVLKYSFIALVVVGTLIGLTIATVYALS